MNNTRAIILMTVSMAAFAGVDAFVKLASRTISAGQILGLSSLAIFVIFFVLLKANRERFFSRQAFGRAMVIRSLGEVVGTVGIIVALGLVPLSTVTVMGQALPLAVTMGAALFLNEAVGLRRWTAVAVGFLGVLVILRPGLEGFDPNVLWVLLYIFGLAARDLASRVLPGSVSTPFAVAWSMVGVTAFGFLMVPFQGGWHPVGAHAALSLTGMVICASAAIALITVAMRTGEVSAVAPFRYTRIVFALIVAFVVFDEVPDWVTWAGSGLIVGSGLYAFVRERRLMAGGDV